MAAPKPRDIAAALAERMADLARDLAGEPSDRRRETWRYGRKGSLAVVIAGPKRGDWFDHEAGCGGDALGLAAHLRREPMREAMRWALAWLGDAAEQMGRTPLTRPIASPEAPREAPQTIDLARRLWAEAVEPAGTLVETYLASRGLMLPDDAPLRFHPRAWRNSASGPHGPAMVALMTDPMANEPCGSHVTYLGQDGRGKAEGRGQKIMLGHVGVIRLVPDEDVTLGLGLAEGIETSLAVMQSFGWRPVWAGTCAGAIARFPVLPGIVALTVFADTDAAGLRSARANCTRWAEAGREARLLAPPTGDWNDGMARAA
jgi:hypothetical protein